MKKFISFVLLATGLAVTARAGLVAGASIGYLVDSEEAYYSARLGYELKPIANSTHQLELEIGYTEYSELGGFASITPLTANYRFLASAGEKFSYHVGAGAGVAQVKVEAAWWAGWYSTHNEAFAAQAFAGVDYKLTPRLSLNLEAKYLWVDDVKFFDQPIEVGDDVVLSAGFSFKF
jgi:opacity protein-like surface antigen